MDLVIYAWSKTLSLCITGGYDIPKGAILAPNTWSMHLDEKNWPQPDAFLPERWLDENGKYVFNQSGFMVLVHVIILVALSVASNIISCL